MNELTIDGKIYISSKKAAELTGYAKDYIGQLCREGHVEARMVGRSWYVLESSIRAHRFGGDSHASPIEGVESQNEAPAALDTWEKPTYITDTAPSMAIPQIQKPAETVVVLPEPIMVTNEDTDALSSAETLTDMQAAWKEWFAQKQDTLIETPEIIDAREEEHELEIAGEEVDPQDEIERNIQAFKDAHRDIEESHHAELAKDELEPVSIQAMHAAPEPVYEEIEEDSEPVLIHHAPEVMLREMQAAEPVINKRELKRAKKEARKARAARKGRASSGNGAASLILQALLIVIIFVAIIVTSIGTGYAERYASGSTILRPVFEYLGGTSTYSK